jgi:chemotaxis protein methyltransferase CheR
MVYDYEYFKKAIFDLTQIDLNSYKEKQMKRRIDTLIAKHKVTGYENYVQLIKTDKEKFEEFVSYLTINVSEFYRNPDQWALMDKEIIPELISKFGKNLKIWSAACSTGDEPYSLVMALSKHIPLNQIKIFATDIDKQILEKARLGLYSEKSIENVPDEFKKKYFTQIGGSYKISDEIKSRVEFKQHNLLKDTYPTGVHMIVCRNVLIYFTEEAKDEVFKKYYDSLAPKGILFIGSTEQIINYKEIGYNRKNSFYYDKP